MKKRILLFVLLGHGFSLLLLCIHHWSSHRNFTHKPIVVNLIQQSTPSVKVCMQKQKTTPPSRPKEKKSKPSSSPKKATPSKKSEPPSFIVAIPKQIEKTEAISPSEQPQLPSYSNLVVHILQQTLQLPEVGEVRARLLLSAKGKVQSVEILDAKSSKNAEWLTVELSHLSLPEFRDYGILEPTLEFTITFHNDRH